MWDYTATQHMVLADLVIDGAVRRVLMQAPTDLLRARSAERQAAVRGALRSGQLGQRRRRATGRPIVESAADYAATGQPWIALPGPLGAHNWQPMAFDPGSGLVYIPSFELGFASWPIALSSGASWP